MGAMTLRAKLSLLLLVLVGAFAISCFGYFAILSPVTEMNEEKKTLDLLRDALQNQELKLNRILGATSFIDARERFVASGEATIKAFAALKGLKSLPKASAAIAESLKTIDRLDGMIVEYSGYLESSLKDVSDMIDKEQLSRDQLFRIDVAKSFKEINPAGFDYAVNKLVGDVDNLSDTIETVIGVIDRQHVLIDVETQKIGAKSITIALGFILLFIGIVLLIALREAGKISASIYAIEDGIGGLKGGDLTRSLAIRRSDEIGRLSCNLDTFVAELRVSIAKIQAVSSENIRMKESLVATAEQTSSSASQIQANTESIEKRISILNKHIGGASASVDSISGSISGLQAQIRDQSAMVEESMASVTEMIAEVENVAKITDGRWVATERLVETVASGGEKMRSAFDIVKRVNERIGSINDIAGIIEDISSRTNLLAMNAAIEAAHAGASGKGFSVVSDEIRKLAEASAVNSKQIGSILKQIVSLIGDATRGGDETSDAFRAIDAEVADLRSSLSEIFTSIRETPQRRPADSKGHDCPGRSLDQGERRIDDHYR